MIRWAGVLMLGIGVLSSPDAVCAQDRGDVRAAVERVFSSNRLQDDLPEGRDAPVTDEDDSWNGPSRRGGSRRAPSSAPPGPGAATGLATGLGWGALGIGLVLLILWLIGLRGRREPAAAAADSGGVEARPAPRRELSPSERVEREAQALAEDGRFDAAAHMLLVDATERVLQRAGRAAEVALTSREVARAARLPEGPADAYVTLVTLVERSLFGGRPLGAADVASGRDAYRRLTSSERAA